MILSFELPFALIPLLKFSSSRTKMGPHKNSMIVSRSLENKTSIPASSIFLSRDYEYRNIILSRNNLQIIVFSWILGLAIIGINIYYLSTGFVDWIIHNSLPRAANVIVGIIVFPLMAVYIVAVVYLMFRRDTVVTFIEPEKSDPAVQAQMEDGTGVMELDRVPYREDLADIPLPE